MIKFLSKNINLIMTAIEPKTTDAQNIHMGDFIIREEKIWFVE